MSATGRSDVRVPGDFYRTPEWVTRAILPHLPTGGTILDAGCGDGSILSVLVAEHLDGVVLGVDNDPALVAATRSRCGTDADGSHLASIVVGDFLRWDQPVDLVIANPPFSLSLEFVEVALEATSARHGVVAMLLRLGWLAGRKRSDFHRAHPSDVFVLERRPSFTADGGTDASEYAWFVWGPGRGGRWSILDAPERGS